MPKDSSKPAPLLGLIDDGVALMPPRLPASKVPPGLINTPLAPPLIERPLATGLIDSPLKKPDSGGKPPA